MSDYWEMYLFSCGSVYPRILREYQGPSSELTPKNQKLKESKIDRCGQRIFFSLFHPQPNLKPGCRKHACRAIQDELQQMKILYANTVESLKQTYLQEQQHLHNVITQLTSKLHSADQKIKALTIQLEIANEETKLLKEIHLFSQQDLQMAREKGQLEVYKEWEESLNADTSIELQFGLHLTRAQLDGIRWTTAFEMREGCLRRKKVSCMDKLVPTLPGRYITTRIANEIAKEHGLKSFERGGWQFDIDTVIQNAVTCNDWADEQGCRHFQFLADGIKIFKNAMITNFAIRAFRPMKFYSSLTGMCVAGVFKI